MLSEQHRRELEEASAIDREVIAERGYCTLTRQQRDELRDTYGVSVSLQAFPGLLLPMYRATGERISCQFKPAAPVLIKGKAVKYLSPRGVGNRLDVHPRSHARIRDVQTPLWITEGLKKGDALVTQDLCVVTLTGVYNWRAPLGTLGDWEDVPLKGRDVIVCFDADAAHNANVARAMARLGQWLRSKGARARYLLPPADMNGRSTKGVDDFFAAGGTLDTLMARATTTPPDTETADDTFTDARLAETLADDVLTGRFTWCKALSWLGWNGQRWAETTEESVAEAVRQYALDRFADAVRDGKKASVHGWQSMLSVGRLRAVLGLAKGIVERTAEAFDADPDTLNTPAGLLDLRTLTVEPHHPDHLVTKITSGIYRPGYTHPDWETALQALRDDASPWMQVRIGQAVTGHTTPDGLIAVLQGSGENGKGCLTTNGIVTAFGDYAAPVSTKLVASREEHSTERADLRGQRFLIAEELTDDRALNITAIKQITDVEYVTARKVHKDNMRFRTSHSLFVNTNPIPIVHETDHGTWRRLALVVFPYTFRKPHEPLQGDTDRRGDPRLKNRIQGGATGQHDAVVTWAVEGARRWYADGMPALPASVEHDTRTWRRQADRILGFWDEHLKADASACIARADLVAAFNLWLTTNGHHAWSEELVNARFKGHSETAKHRVHEARPRGGATPDRPTWIALNPLPERPRIYLGVRFRTPAEIGENTEEIRQNAASGPTGPTQKETFSRSRGTKKFPKGLDHVDQSPDFDPDCEVTSDPMFDHGTQAVCAPSAPPVSMDEADEWEVFES